MVTTILFMLAHSLMDSHHRISHPNIHVLIVICMLYKLFVYISRKHRDASPHLKDAFPCSLVPRSMGMLKGTFLRCTPFWGNSKGASLKCFQALGSHPHKNVQKGDGWGTFDCPRGQSNRPQRWSVVPFCFTTSKL